MTAFYNECDPFAAQWLRNLIDAGHIAPGVVDERSIVELDPEELRAYTQVHLFAGIAGWSHALRLAGWPDERPVWTGSCPCQPFSTAGAGRGTADERHLWPVMFELVAECAPPVVFGEQVGSPAGIEWWDGVENLHEVRSREAVAAVLQELERERSGGMQAVLPRAQRPRAREFRKEEDVCGIQAVARHQSRQGPLQRGETPSQEEGHRVQSGCAGYPGGDRRGHLPTDGHPVQPARREDVEQSIARPHRQRTGLHPGQRGRGNLCPERDEQLLGGGRHGEGERGATEAARIAERVAHAALSRELPTAYGREGQSSVRADLESIGYSCGALVAPAAGVGAPHIRQRLFWVADGAGERGDGAQDSSGTSRWAGAEDRCDLRGLGNSDRQRLAGERVQLLAGRQVEAVPQVDGDGECSGLGDSNGASARRHGRAVPRAQAACSSEREQAGHFSHGHGNASEPCSPWSRPDWVLCDDPGGPRWRPVEPGSFPLVDGLPGRVGRLRAYGNAIVPQVAAEFIGAFLEAAQ